METFVEEGASLGAGSVVLPGVRIGAYAMVGASSLVSRNVPAYRLALGHPARCVGWVDEFGKRLVADGNTWCEPRSGRIYRIIDDRPHLIS